MLQTLARAQAAARSGALLRPLLVLCLAGCTLPPAEPPPPFLTIDGVPVSKEAFVEAMLEDSGEAFVRRFVDAWLVERAAKAAGLSLEEAEIQAAVEADLKRALEGRFGGDRKAFEAQLERYGLDEAGWRKQRARRLRVRMLSERLLKAEGREARLKRLFEERYGAGGVRRSYSHILVSTRLANSRFYTRARFDAERGEVVAQARAKANELRGRIAAGGDFASLAKKWSDDYSAARGGELGPNWTGRFGAAFDEAVRELEVGQLSRVVESKRGYHVVGVTGMRKGARYEGEYILVKAKPGAAEQEEARFAAALSEAEGARAQIEGGQAFAEVAKAVSSDVVSRARGGDLGSFGPGRLGSEVDVVLETLPLKQLSRPVRVSEGYALVRLRSREWLPGRDKKLVRHILVATEYTKVKARRLGGKLEGLALKKAEALLKKARAEGADFAALAKKASEDELTRRIGGKVDRHRPGELGEAAEAVLGEMKPGEIRLLRSKRGHHVLRLDAAVAADFAQVRSELEASLDKQPVGEAAIKRLVADLRAKAKVLRDLPAPVEGPPAAP